MGRLVHRGCIGSWAVVRGTIVRFIRINSTPSRAKAVRQGLRLGRSAYNISCKSFCSTLRRTLLPVCYYTSSLYAITNRLKRPLPSHKIFTGDGAINTMACVLECLVTVFSLLNNNTLLTFLFFRCLKKYNTETSNFQYVRRNAFVHIIFSFFSMLCCFCTLSCILSYEKNVILTRGYRTGLYSNDFLYVDRQRYA